MRVVTSKKLLDVEEFEALFEDYLRMSLEEKTQLAQRGKLFYIGENGRTIGECLVIPKDVLNKVEEEALEPDYLDSWYVYSTAIKKSHQGMGYAHDLTKDVTKMLIRKKVPYLTGHATTRAMKVIRAKAGAIFFEPVPHWCGSDRIAWPYVQFLPQTTEWNCGPTALSYALASTLRCYTITQLTEELETTPEDGTIFENIRKWLQKNVPSSSFESVDEIPSGSYDNNPIIVNVTFEDDGHYVVVTGATDTKVMYWDPSDAQSHFEPRDRFELCWFSKRYGPRNGIRVFS